jgi:membrane metallo-endopeptidase-like protein 1
MSNKYATDVGSSETQLNSEYDSHGKSKSKSKLFYLVVVLAVVFFATTIVFVGLFANQVVKNDEPQPLKEPAPTADPNAKNVCLDPECVIAAGVLLSKMNVTANPCEDFNEYACGRFIKETSIPDGYTDIVSFTLASDANNIIMKEIINEKDKPGDPAYLTNMKAFYKSCVDEDEIEKKGLNDYHEDPLSKNWPLVNSTWTDTNFNLAEVIAHYLTFNVAPFFDFSVDTEEKNSSKISIYLGQPTLGLGPEYFNKSDNDTNIVAYKAYLVDTAVALGANRTTVEKDVQDVVALEQALSQIMVLKQDMRNSSKQYNPISLVNLTSLYPELDVSAALNATFKTVNISLTDDDIVINRFPSYISQITSVLQHFNNSIIQNLFGFKYAIPRVGSLTKELRNIKLKYDKVLRGATAEYPRWQVCLVATASAFPDGMGKKYVEKSFPNASKIYMEKMVDNLKSTFQAMIEETTWMSNKTKVAAVQKLKAMQRKIGYPDANFQDADLNKRYAEYNMSVDNYYANRILKDKLVTERHLLQLRKPVDKTEWGMAPYTVNAQYSPNWNDITFPAGILQKPFYSPTYLNSLNYGGIGVVIGHEITHGFDDQGRQYDADGNLRDWWQKSDLDSFVNKSQCIVDQFSNFYVKEINEFVNGKHTQGESAADTGGVKESFRAYKKLVGKKGEQTLPVLNLSADQLFFLSFGQIWCDKITDGALRSQVLSNEHPPGKYRIIGTLQNSEDFAKAYNCPKGSYMNPAKKCGVW